MTAPASDWGMFNTEDNRNAQDAREAMLCLSLAILAVLAFLTLTCYSQ